MRSIQRLLGLDPNAASRSESDTQTVRRVADQLSELAPERARYLASYAYILARVAHSDLEISDSELSRIESLIAREGQLEPAEAALIAQIVRFQVTNFGGTEDYLVTRQFADVATREQAYSLVRCLYQVAATDAGISVREDAQIRQIADELRLTHQEVIALRAPFRDELAELRNEP